MTAPDEESDGDPDEDLYKTAALEVLQAAWKEVGEFLAQEDQKRKYHDNDLANQRLNETSDTD